MSGKKTAMLIVSSIGGLFLLTGLILLFLGRMQAQKIERIAGGAVVRSATELAQAPAGTVIMAQGQIAERNKPLEQGFVAYTLSQYQGERCATPTPSRDNEQGDAICEAIWVETGRQTPPLWIDLSGGRVQLADADYQLQNPPVTWQSTATLVKNQTVRYEGFKIGNPVFARGTVATAGITPTLQAEFIFGGDSQAYFDAQRSNNAILFLLGGIFMGVSVAAFTTTGVILWAGRKK